MVDDLDFLGDENEGPLDWPDEPLCARCYDLGPLYEANCTEKPERLIGVPLGQYHCPDCGAMVLAGLPHPWLCKLCLDRRHPGYDTPDVENSGTIDAS